MSTLHPDHLGRTQTAGTLAGYQVQTISLDMADHPERPKSCMALNSSQTWARWSEGEWVRTNRVSRNLDLLSVEWSAADAAEVWGALIGGQGWIPVAEANCADPKRRAWAEKAWCTTYAQRVFRRGERIYGRVKP